MASTKGEITHQHLLQVAGEAENDANAEDKNKRIASIDIFRGFTVALMILVDDAGDEWPIIGHAHWNGCHLADFVMPFFLFIVGMAIALALKRIPNHQLAIRKVVLRTLKLLFFGLLLQGGFSHAPDILTYGVDMQRIRWCGILQVRSISTLHVLTFLLNECQKISITTLLWSLLECSPLKQTKNNEFKNKKTSC